MPFWTDGSWRPVKMLSFWISLVLCNIFIYTVNVKLSSYYRTQGKNIRQIWFVCCGWLDLPSLAPESVFSPIRDHNTQSQWIDLRAEQSSIWSKHFLCSSCHWLPVTLHIISILNILTFLYLTAPLFFCLCVITDPFGKPFYCRFHIVLHNINII